MPELAVGDTAPAATSAPPSSGAPPAPTGSPVSDAPATSATSPAPAPTSLGQALRQANGTPGSEMPEGPIPLDRHKAILETQRKEYEDYKARVSWAEKVQESDFQRIANLDQSLATDPVGFAQRLMLEAMNDPRYAAQVRSLAGQALRGQPRAQQQPAAPAEDPMPAPDADGGYSPDGLTKLLQWQEQRTLKAAQQQFAPLMQFVQQLKTEQQQTERQNAIQQRANVAFDQLKALPQFNEHAEEIQKVFLALPAKTTDDLIHNAYRAYTQIVTPKIEGIAKQKALTDLETQARASTTRPTGGRTPVIAASQPPRLGQAVKEAMTGQR